MPLPGSGTLRISCINAELSRTATTANSSLAGGSTVNNSSLFGLANQYGCINVASPHSMSEFYNYTAIPRTCLVLYVNAGVGTSYPGSGTTWTDIVNGYNNTLTNGPTYSSTNGGGITFDGSNDYAQGNNSLASVISTAITLIVFAKVPNFNNRVPLFGKFQTTAPFGYVLEVGTLSSLWTRTMRFYAQGDNDPNYSTDYRGTVQLTDNQIYMFTAQYSNTQCVMRMYYNTTEMTATQVNPNCFAVFNWGAGTNVYYLGAYAPSVGVYGSSTIYNTLVYNRILSTSEIQQTYNALRIRIGV
jgi:hypothetical protein